MRNLTTHKDEDFPTGLLVIPPTHLLEIETEGSAQIQVASIADGTMFYAPCQVRTRDQLRVMVAHLEAFLPSLVAVSEAGPASPSLKAAPGWIALAQTTAREIIKRQRAKDLHPSQVDIANEIAASFRTTTPQVVGAGGKPLTGSYIKRHALKGISSEQGRQQSMKPRRGK